MILDFDYDYAREVLEFGSGRIKTKEGYPVEIESWELGGSLYPIRGWICVGTGQIWETWTKEGTWNSHPGSLSDLVIEIDDSI